MRTVNQGQVGLVYGRTREKIRTVDQGQVSWVVESGKKRKKKGQVCWNVSESLPRFTTIPEQ